MVRVTIHEMGRIFSSGINAMMTLYTYTTPNGRKISIMLEELGIPYNVKVINLSKQEQFDPSFTAISITKSRLLSITQTKLRRWHYLKVAQFSRISPKSMIAFFLLSAPRDTKHWNGFTGKWVASVRCLVS